MSKILSKNNILQPVKVGLSHKSSHIFMNKVDVVFCLDDPVHIDIHSDGETVVYILPDECKDQLEKLGCNIILNFANIDPFKCCL